MSRLKVTGIAAAIALSLGGCASSPPPLGQLRVQEARQQGDLKALYDQNTARIAGKNLRSRKGHEALVQHNAMGTQLAQNLEEQFRREQKEQLTPEGLVPLPLIEAQVAQAPETIKWDFAIYRKLTDELTATREKTRAGIAAQQEQLSKLGQEDVVQRVAVLQSLAGLTRDERYSREREDVIAGLRKKIDDAIKSERYGDAKLALGDLQQITPDDKTIPTQLLLVNTRLFEQEFWSQLGDGLADDAYAQFMTLSEEFPDSLQLLGGAVNDMVSYFIAQAGTAFSENRMADTYRLLNQVRDLRAKINAQPTERAPQEEAFLKAMFARYEAASKADQTGLALGYLKVIERFDPQYPGLQDSLRATQELALAKATKKMELAAFTNASGNTEFGTAVAAGLTQHLSDKMPKGIQLVDRKQAEAAAPAKKKGKKAAKAAEAVAADYLIQGQILESRVDSSNDPGQKTMRVVTGTETVDNPAHLEWAALPEAQRATLPEPERTLTQEKSEDVAVDMQVLRKVGVVTASYRLVDAKTGTVLATGTETVREELMDEGNKGVEIGQFKLPLKQAHLPSDTEILQKLTARISGVIGDRLVQQLQSPEVRYAEAAKRFVQEGNLAMAAENEAYSFTLATLNGQQTSAQTLEQYAITAPPDTPAAQP